MCFIYKLTSPNGKVYIGQSKQTFDHRMSCHKSAAKNLDKTDGCRLLNNAIRKYGWDNFQKEIIWTCDYGELNISEEIFITVYNSLAPNGYNLTTGGDSGLKSEVTKQKMRESALKRDSALYRKKDSTKELGKYLGEYGNGYRIAKHPRCPIKYFTEKPTREENKIDAEQFLQHLNADETITVVPKKHDLIDGIQRCGYGYRVRYVNKHNIELTARFTRKCFTNEELYIQAQTKLQEFKNNDN